MSTYQYLNCYASEATLNPASISIICKSSLSSLQLVVIGTRNDVIIQKEFVSDLEKAAAKAVMDIPFGSIAKQVDHYSNPWFIFKRYNDAVDGQCAKYMLPKWETRLWGTGLYGKSLLYYD